MAILSVCFAWPLFSLMRYAINDEFFSYIPLIPLISIYLTYLALPGLPKETKESWLAGIIPALAGVALFVGVKWQIHSGWRPEMENYLTLAMAAYILLLTGGCLIFLGTKICRLLAFQIIFLIFMIPMPSGLLAWTVAFFQQTSAATAHAMLSMCGMAVFQEDLVLHLPGFSIVVAPECSGIHSTMVLLITGALAGHLFLRSGWKRALLIVVVVPLAILRNGFRIFVIAELCVRISHDMINSPIHHKGGPIFFALSLIPFFALLYYLRKSELPLRPNVNDAVKA